MRDSVLGAARLATPVRSAIAAGAAAWALVAAAAPAQAAAGERDRACEHRGERAERFGSTPCPGVRPGGLVHIELPGLPPGVGDPVALPVPHCTLGFLWRARGRRYVSTAGHCTGVKGTWAEGGGPVAYDGERRRIGEVVYSRHHAPWTDGSHPSPAPPDPEDEAQDFALIRLDRGVAADPAVCHFGGPTGIDEDVVARTLTPPNLIALHYYGNGFAGGYHEGAGWVLPARTGVSHGLPNPRWLYFTGHLSQRDSGGPILTGDGRAIALISGGGGIDSETEPDPAPYAGSARSPRLAHQVEAAEKALDLGLRLETSPWG